MPSKAEAAKSAAYDAGRAAYLTEPPERRHPDSCPFEPGSDERTAWLEGFEAALNEAIPHDDLRAALREAK